MHFIVDSDTGDSINGWLVLDNPSAIPSFTVVIPGREEFTFEANVPRDGIRDMGLHATGQVGFSLNADLVPDLAELDDVALLESQSRMPVFRRFQPGAQIEKKLFVFDCSLMPQRRIVNEIERHFALSYFNSERYGLETTISLIANPFCKSIFMSGRSNFSRCSFFLTESGYVRAAILREPFEELAERLLFLAFAAKSDTPAVAPEYFSGVEPLLTFVRDLPLNDAKGLKAAFAGATDEQKLALTSPMTRVLGCEVGDVPQPANVSIALDNLASLDVVGTRDRYDLFRALLTAALGANPLGEEEPMSFQSVQTLAATLRKIRPVGDLLHEDVMLYAYVAKAIATGVELTR